MMSFFKKYCLLILLLNLSTQLLSQQNHFIYLQTENKQPFYVKLDKKLLSSSASGYLIIPRLTDGTYKLTLGFPKNEWPEQELSCSIDKKDAGFVIKNFGDKGWGLFNWQTMDVVMAGTKIMEPVTAAEKTEPAAVKAVPAEKIIVKEEAKMEKPAPAITRIVNSKTEEGMEMVYVDIITGSPDTIRVFIPAEKKVIPVQPVVVAKQAETVKQEDKPEKKVVETDIVKPLPPAPAEKKDSSITTKIIAAPVKENEKPVVAESPVTAAKPVIPNSDCKVLAAEEDFLKLRKKMAAEDNDDDMVAVARKVFKTKCFTVEQVKNLSVLFLNDNGRYQFFDAAYPFVSDSYNFSSLVSLLSDEYFITRFKAMLRR
jgi:Domain of unknown function (DUF4476)